MNELRFSQQWVNVTSPISIKFEFNGISIRFDKQWTPLTSPITIRFIDDGEPPIVIGNSIGVEYGLNWFDVGLTEVVIPIGNFSNSVGEQVNLIWVTNPMINQDASLIWSVKPLTSTYANFSWLTYYMVTEYVSVSWSLPKSFYASYDIEWSSGIFIEINSDVPWEFGKPVSYVNLIPFEHYHYVGLHTALRYMFIESPYGDNILKWGYTPPRWICSTDYRPPEVGVITIRFTSNYINGTTPVTLRFTPSDNYCYYDNGGGYIDANPVLPDIDFKIPINPQVQRAYLMEPTLTCKRVSDNLPIVINSVSISDRRGQHTKSIDIEFSSKIDSKQAENELLLISINGYDFYAIAEQPVKREFFGSATYSSGCRSRTATLAEPWVLPISYTNSVSRSFAGMLGDMIANTGWSIELDGITDFNVPAGAFSTFGKSPIDSISDAVKQVGCMTVVDEFTSVIKVVPQWPTAPWVMDSTTPDANIHDAVIIDWTSSIQINKLCDVAWLRGEQHGVSAKVKRTGTAGNIPTTDIAQQLIVDTQAARVAGTVALADTGNKELITINLPIMADLPPLTKGMLVGVTYRTEVFKATLDSVNITASMSNDSGLDVNQSIVLIRHLE
ncbi:baseplate protein [Shewanella sp. phage 1/44]|uniref:tail protein n=1 Tax=Shewanella sp. phage 1/44 TaxID=1458862 RepID=UPI0004F87FFE|nr:tail protein [Shewanella sp. phage 1/44]AHK11756.1 baseplate protein [Shewanella sp. phage 1/44]